MKKGALFLLVSLLILPVSLADISIQTEQNTYNLGNKIRVSASVLQPNSFEGLFKLTLNCGTYNLQYFLTPISLEANFRSAVDVPEVVATSSMLGDCTVIGNLLTNDNLVIEEKNSNNFAVTNQLDVLPVNRRITALPGDAIQVTGVVNEAYGNNVLKASAKITLDSNSYVIDAIDGKFNLTLQLNKNIKSGRHIIEISALDSKNNAGSAEVELEITAVPTYIQMDLSGNQILPGSKIGITASLYDQADDLINASIDLELTAPNKEKVFRKTAQSNEKLDYEFSQYAEPGIYLLISSYNSLLAQSQLNVTAIREVKIKYENEGVFIENIGNVPFEDELTFILESKQKKYPILKKISVEPGKLLSIDLSKEVPLGIYDIKLPMKEGLEPVREKVGEIIQSAAESAQESLINLLPENENLLASDVEIHDNRPLYKKFTGSLSSLGGTLVGADGLLAKNPLLAPAILIAIVLIIVFRYGRKPIIRLIKGKKDDNNKENQN